MENERIAKALRENFPGWALTVRFYAAVHFVRAYLATKGTQIESHEQMRALWRNLPELRSARVSYDLLKNKSEQARYYLVDFSVAQFDETEHHLIKIKSLLEAKIQRGLRGHS